MNRTHKSVMAAMAAGVGLGYMAAKRHYDTKSSYRKLLDKLEDYID